MALTDTEVRVLGALMEKEATTPEAYPLSTQSLLTACNQKTSRAPVTDLHLQEVQEAVRRARDRGLLETVHDTGARVPKHRHRMRGAMSLNRTEAAVLSVLMLRGPQTAGELRGRIERYGPHVDVAEVTATLMALADRPASLAQNRGRAPGQSQDRWVHTLAADEERLRPRARPVSRFDTDTDTDTDPGAELAGENAAAAPGAGDETHAVAAPSVEERFAALERRVAALEAALEGALDTSVDTAVDERR